MTVKPQKSVTANRAAVLLGIKPATLYAYVSRGLIKPTGKDAKRRSLFRVADVERLKARSRVSKGRGVVAAEALQWGDPVLESSITKITSEGPAYRGHLALELAEQDTSFERVSELLWSGVLPEREVLWDEGVHRWLGETSQLPGDFSGIFMRMMQLGAGRTAAASADALFDRQFIDARLFIHELALDFSYRFSNGRLHKPDGSIAGLLAVPANKNFALARQLINRALVVCADHELTASTFACRVSASTGASALASVASAFGAMSGKQHGAHFAVIRGEVARLAGLGVTALKRELADGEILSGFHHTLYPDGDPRSLALMPFFLQAEETTEDFRFMLSLCNRMNDIRGIRAPTIDLALLMVCSLLEIKEEFAAVLFGIGRVAGLFAHFQEQRMSGFMVRPRARYSGR